MSKKLRQAVAIIALIFMAAFAVSIVLCLIDITMLNGSVGFLALFTGFLGISLFFVIYFNDKAAKRNEEAAKRHDLTGAEPPEKKSDTEETAPSSEEADAAPEETADTDGTTDA